MANEELQKTEDQLAEAVSAPVVTAENEMAEELSHFVIDKKTEAQGILAKIEAEVATLGQIGHLYYVNLVRQNISELIQALKNHI